MKIVKINHDNRNLVQKFLVGAGESLHSFTYFDKRDLNILDCHEVTLILIENDEAIGYGHLDREKDTVWLGIAVSEGYTGKGLGKKIMNELISCAREKKIKDIRLSVYKNNIPAQKLYEKLGFEKVDETEESLYYNLQVSQI